MSEPVDSTVSIKTRLSALVHNKQTFCAIRTVVLEFKVATKAAWLFARWILLSELEQNPEWDPSADISESFLYEVLLSCIDCKRITPRVESTKRVRNLIVGSCIFLQVSRQVWFRGRITLKCLPTGSRYVGRYLRYLGIDFQSSRLLPMQPHLVKSASPSSLSWNAITTTTTTTTTNTSTITITNTTNTGSNHV